MEAPYVVVKESLVIGIDGLGGMGSRLDGDMTP